VQDRSAFRLSEGFQLADIVVPSVSSPVGMVSIKRKVSRSLEKVEPEEGLEAADGQGLSYSIRSFNRGFRFRSLP